MGNFGSGNYLPRPNRKATIEEFSQRCLAVTWFTGFEVLVDGGSGCFTWQSPRTYSVILEADFEVRSHKDGGLSLVLTYQLGGDMTPRQEEIRLQHDAVHFGGVRWWLVCPRCAERRAKLYLRNSQFACRVCHGLTYRSCQRAHYEEREIAAMARLCELYGKTRQEKGELAGRTPSHA